MNLKLPGTRPPRAGGPASRGGAVSGSRVGEEAVAPRRSDFAVEGMCCASEVRQIEGTLGTLPGVERLGFDPVRQRLTVEGEIAPAQVERALAGLGMRARRMGEVRPEAGWWERRGRLALTVLAGLFWGGALVAEHLLAVPWLAGVLALGAIVTGGRYVFPRGVRALRNRSLDMNFLMSAAAVGAILIGEYQEAASVMFLFAVAQLLERSSMDRARRSIRSLMELSPAEATVLRGGRELRVPVDRVGVGETVVVRPGEKIPVDGEVLAGHSSVDQASITGESIPVEKEPGTEVFAGTLNGEGALEVRAGRAASDSTLARIIHSVEEAQASRAPSQAFVDRFARIYTPAVVATAILIGVVPPLLGLGAWGEWFYRALVLLVVACPCALVISTPVTVVSALAGAARRGILIKGGLHLENAGRARVVALDKTGTLTLGQPAVVEVVAFDGSDRRGVLALAARAESRSEHPLARAILDHARKEAVEVEAADTRAIPGRGVQARIGGELVRVGGGRFFSEAQLRREGVSEALQRFDREGRTAVLVARSAAGVEEPETIVGAIAIADRVRPGARAALQALRLAGIDRVVMLTGDTGGTARTVAAELGVDDYRAELLPQEKVEAIRALRAERGPVVMVGDGVNDAPALAIADVGVAMGSAGTDIALETADIALMTDDLSRLATTIGLARRAEGIIRTNIWLALLSKAAFVLLAVAGAATLWMAVVADMGVSLLVVANGLRALHDGSREGNPG